MALKATLTYVLGFTIGLLGCGGVEADCVTTCGIAAMGTTDCEGLQKAEDRALATFDYYLGWTPARSCSALNGVSLDVRNDPEGWYIDPFGRKIAGATFIEVDHIVIAWDHWSKSAFAHELIHLFQWKLDRTEDFHHVGWCGAIDLAIWDANDPEAEFGARSIGYPKGSKCNP